MIIDDLWTADGPKAADLKVLERLARRRRKLEDTTADDEEEAMVIGHALATLDDMEECLCEEGSGAPLLTEGWQALDTLEARLEQLQASAHPTMALAGVVPINPPSIPPFAKGGSTERRHQPSISSTEGSSPQKLECPHNQGDLPDAA